MAAFCSGPPDQTNPQGTSTSFANCTPVVTCYYRKNTGGDGFRPRKPALIENVNGEITATTLLISAANSERTANRHFSSCICINKNGHLPGSAQQQPQSSYGHIRLRRFSGPYPSCRYRGQSWSVLARGLRGFSSKPLKERAMVVSRTGIKGRACSARSAIQSPIANRRKVDRSKRWRLVGTISPPNFRKKRCAPPRL